MTKQNNKLSYGNFLLKLRWNIAILWWTITVTSLSPTIDLFACCLTRRFFGPMWRHLMNAGFRMNHSCYFCGNWLFRNRLCCCIRCAGVRNCSVPIISTWTLLKMLAFYIERIIFKRKDRIRWKDLPCWLSLVRGGMPIPLIDERLAELVRLDIPPSESVERELLERRRQKIIDKPWKYVESRT